MKNKKVNNSLKEKPLEKIIKTCEGLAHNYKYKKGISLIEKYLSTRPADTNEKILSLLGMMYDHEALYNTKKKNYYEKRAMYIYNQILRINPKSYKATWGIGRIWWHRKNRKALYFALQAYRLRKIQSKSTGLYPQHIGLVYQSLNNDRNAIKWFRRGIQENPKNWDSYVNIIFLLFKKGKYNMAKKYTSKMKKLLFVQEDKVFLESEWGKKILHTIQEIEGNKK